jgi:hypothetical protein
MAVLVNAPSTGLRSYEDVLEATEAETAASPFSTASR